ncbi:MAG: hypothetical protein AB8B59_03950 [Maribacter sp.]
MNLARHCALCDNQLVNIKEGTTCKLTSKKPEFNKTCTKIELNEKFEKKIKKVNIELENIKRTKTDTIGHVVIFTVISLAVIFAGYYLGKYAWDGGVISITPLIIITIGLGVLVLAVGPLNKFRNDMLITKDNKDKLDEVLDLYNIEYEIDLKYGKEVHGVKNVQTDLKIKGIR